MKYFCIRITTKNFHFYSNILTFLIFSLLLIQSFQCENQYARKNGRNKINGRMPSMKIYLHLIMCTQLNNYKHSIAQTAFSVIQFG